MPRICRNRHPLACKCLIARLKSPPLHRTISRAWQAPSQRILGAGYNHAFAIFICKLSNIYAAPWHRMHKLGSIFWQCSLCLSTQIKPTSSTLLKPRSDGSGVAIACSPLSVMIPLNSGSSRPACSLRNMLRSGASTSQTFSLHMVKTRAVHSSAPDDIHWQCHTALLK